MWMCALILACAFLAVEAQFRVKDPELGAFQDYGKCYPLKQTWFVLYRSYESDPYFGLTAKCLRVHSTEVPFVNNSTRLRTEFGDHGIFDINFKVFASEGYKHLNSFRTSAADGTEGEIDLHVAYVDCSTCKIIMHPYISKTACSLMVPEQHVANPHSACHFIYRMLCGSKKVQIYDESCRKHH